MTIRSAANACAGVAPVAMAEALPCWSEAHITTTSSAGAVRSVRSSADPGQPTSISAPGASPVTRTEWSQRPVESGVGRVHCDPFARHTPAPSGRQWSRPSALSEHQETITPVDASTHGSAHARCIVCAASVPVQTRRPET